MIEAVDRKYFVKVFGDIVQDVREEWATNSEQPYYTYGHPLEIATILTQKSSTNEWKHRQYPLICLLQDFQETINSRNDYYEVSPTVLIVAQSSGDLTASQRYAETFEPILYPLLQLLLTAIEYSPHVSPVQEFVEYTKTDRVFWGASTIQGNTALLFNGTLDCIELNFRNLKIKKQC